MPDRARALTHPSGAAVDLPLLIPSFSSKGFQFYEKQETIRTTSKRPAGRRRRFSQASLALEAMSPYLTESLLISAYDLHHNHFENPQAHLKQAALVFLDSGGYEL